MTFCHQVNIFPRIVLLSSSQSGRPSVPFVAMVDIMKKNSSPPKQRNLFAQQHIVTSHKIRSYANLKPGITLCYQYYVRNNTIIQNVST